MLFVANAGDFFENNAFRIKILLLILGAVLLTVEWKRVLSAPATAEAIANSSTVKIIAGISVTAWIGVIVAGRLIAYVGDAYPTFLSR